MQKITKISVTDTADQALDRMLVLVNDGFNGGRVSKTDLASWILAQFEQSSFQSQIEQIRTDNFDQVQYLLSVVKELKRAKKEEKEISVAEILAPLTAQLNLSSAQSKRRSKKPENRSSQDPNDLGPDQS